MEILYPFTGSYKSKIGIDKGNDIYNWNNEIVFERKLLNTLHLHNEYMEIIVWSNMKGAKRTSGTIIGSVKIDLFTLFVGTVQHKYKLQHSLYDCDIEFNISGGEKTNTVISMDKFLIKNVSKEFVSLTYYINI